MNLSRPRRQIQELLGLSPVGVLIQPPAVIPDAETKDAKKILYCSGKVYYDLLAVSTLAPSRHRNKTFL